MLRAVVIADPVESVAALISERCQRLAEKHVVVTTGQALLESARQFKPDLVVYSLELADVDPEVAAKQIVRDISDVLLIATFRELGVPRMERLGRAGVDEFVAHPIDMTSIFRAVHRRFNIAIRQYERFAASFDVMRGDGVVLGRTVNISEGGMCMESAHQLSPHVSLLVELAVPDARPPVRVRFHILDVDGRAPARVRIRGQFENLRGEEYRRLVGYLGDLAKKAEESDRDHPPSAN